MSASSWAAANPEEAATILRAGLRIAASAIATKMTQEQRASASLMLSPAHQENAYAPVSPTHYWDGKLHSASEARMHAHGTRSVFVRLVCAAMATLSLLLGACGSVPAGTGTSASATALPVASSAVPPRPVVIDTDMAADDWMAVLYLLRRPDVAVKAITVAGDGEANCEPGTRHALGLVALANRGVIPVACGRTTPLQGDHAFPAQWRADVDSLLGLTLPTTTATMTQQTEVDLLTSVIGASPQPVVLLTLGPLTNVAEALQRTPALVKKLAMIYIMGGAVEVPGNIAD
jgi:hypothetical protein